MIKKRNEKAISLIENDTNKKEVSKPKKAVTFSQKEIKSFRDKAIEILNKLEAKGQNIYDESREPGMYIKERLIREYNGFPTEVKVLFDKDKKTEKEPNIKDLFKNDK